ncbi:MAG: ABC transporter ATP-binding protein [Stellaceae bacterium]
MSAAVEISGLSLKLGSFALRDVSLTLDEGEILVILGPNGAGKSVSLEAIAGFHRLLGGRVVIGGRDVTRLPPERRHLSLMFQNFGLFPHLSVVQNVVFGQSAARIRIFARHRAGGSDPARLLARFGIAPLAAERPDTLSPGQKQRVALARAFAARPELYLFDEPFAAIDLPTREELREDLKAFLRDSGVPAIFVTHDRSDADALADRLAIMAEGRIVQTGEAAEVLSRPADTVVARFLGVENILPGRTVGRANGVAHIAVGETVITARPIVARPGGAGAVALCIRAEDVAALPADGEDAGTEAVNRLAARVGAITPLGPFCKVTLDCGFPLVAHLPKRAVRALALAPGSRVVAEIEVESIHVLPADRPR